MFAALDQLPRAGRSRPGSCPGPLCGHRRGRRGSAGARRRGGLFVDTCRGGRRRWCSMATCGSTVEKAAPKARAGGVE
ncbi:CGNR zinc finger domain-containing protein [Actinacidiphila yeochonensis]|uniref:CGNR zinc finger domain-containing protein n=1 Tax=Actinacidiphila yeochonensis TaxID=89050 RepID=UPI001E499DB1|nr:CGNR zinc finger domain-containing protein [Actinacidiphila yeochonensis]